jgi:tRNA/rRNA methyltransferase
MIVVAENADRLREPRLAANGIAVAELVRIAYEQGVVALIESEAGRTLDAGSAIEVLRYCAERRCDAAGARCRACRLWSEEAGLTTLDEFCARFGSITASETGLRVSGGSGPALAPPPATLEELARTWAGEEFWFLARRVIRRFRHKGSQGEKLRGTAAHWPSPVFVLVAPQMADNIGMVARAMANFAVEELRLVSPRDGWPNAKARAASSGAHAIIDEAQAYATTQEAIGDLNWVAATTARPRHLAKPVLTPEEAAKEMARRVARGERCGVLFGPERTGLGTDDIANADAIVMARVSPTFASLNLAQAVLLLGYEWMRETGSGTVGRHTRDDGIVASEDEAPQRASPRATKEQVAGFLAQLEAELDSAQHFPSPEKRQIMLRNMRTMFERMEASEQEVRTLRGIVASLTRLRNTGHEGL